MRTGKARNLPLTSDWLARRAAVSTEKGFSKQKWIIFCETLLEKGYSLKLYEAKETVSKYVTVMKDNKEFKVRFSNHKPIYQKEVGGDCDFFVGVTHTGVRTTDDALRAVEKFFS